MKRKIAFLLLATIAVVAHRPGSKKKEVSGYRSKNYMVVPIDNKLTFIYMNGKIKTRRHRIIKCCGTKGCADYVSNRNVTKLRKSSPSQMSITSTQNVKTESITLDSISTEKESTALPEEQVSQIDQDTPSNENNSPASDLDTQEATSSSTALNNEAQKTSSTTSSDFSQNQEPISSSSTGTPTKSTGTLSTSSVTTTKLINSSSTVPTDSSIPTGSTQTLTTGSTNSKETPNLSTSLQSSSPTSSIQNQQMTTPMPTATSTASTKVEITSSIISSATPTISSSMSSTAESQTATSSPPTLTTEPEIQILPNCSGAAGRNDSLFNSVGSLIAPYKYGEWAEYCGNQILFGNGLVDWPTNLAKCISIGMTPLVIESSTKKSCLSSLNDKFWRRRRSFWTSAYRVDNSSTFTWCYSPTVANVTSTSQFWAPGQPNLTTIEMCAFGNLLRYETTFGLFDAACSRKFLWACQGAPTVSPCTTCPSVPTTKNPTYFTKIDQETYRSLKDPNTLGEWYSINGRQYLFSKTGKRWLDALKMCYALGMKLLNLEFDPKAASIIQAMNTVSPNRVMPPPGLYWTSGLNNICDNVTKWCSINKFAIRPQWKAGEPSGGAESCVAVEALKTSALLTDQDCNLQLKYICEIRDTTNHSEKSMAIVNECALTYNISQAQVDEIINNGTLDLTNYSLMIKCFVKCLGEQGGVFWNGRLIDDSVIGILEMMGGSYETRGKIMITKCGQTQHMDECEAAAAIIKCGIETDAEITKHLITTYSLHPDMEMSPTLTSKAICPNYECVVDPDKRYNYLNNISSAEGFFIDGCGVRYFIGLVPMVYRTAASLCCQMGLQPISLETALEHKCLSVTANPHRPILGLPFSSFIFLWTSASLPLQIGGPPVWCTSNKPVDFYWNWKYSDHTPSTYPGTQVCHVSDENDLGMNLRSHEDSELERFFATCEERIY